MKDGNKIKNNLLIGIGCQLLAMILGVLVPKLVLNNYGSEINGLLSSVTNIYACIALVEAGVMAASCQALYKALAKNTRDDANSVLSATNIYYRRTGLIYSALIAVFSVVYPLFIKSEIPFWTVFLVILFNGLGNVVNFFFHGKYLFLLKADGKNYVRSGVEMFSNAAKQISKIVLISLGFNVVFVQFAAMLTSFAQMIYITYYIKKHYSWIDLNAKPNFESISQSKNVFVHEVNFLITTNVDTVLLTLFSTLKQVSVYSLYNLIYNMVFRVIHTIQESLEFKVAYAFHTDREAFLKIFKAYETYFITFSFVLYTIMTYFALPFMALYTKGVDDVDYLLSNLPLAFAVMNLMTIGKYPSLSMVHIANHFKQTQNSAIIEAVINILVSIVLIQFYGIYGALLGTMASSFYRTNYLVLYVNKKIINRSSFGTYKCLFLNFAVFGLIMYLNKYIVFEIASYGKLFLYCIPYSLCVLLVYFIVAAISEPKTFAFVLQTVKRMLNSREVVNEN